MPVEVLKSKKKYPVLMKIRFIVLVLLVAMACQTGRIPCPRVKYVKAKRTVIRRNFQQSEQSMQARAASRAEEEKSQSRGVRGAEEKMVHNVSAEEWDCPRPGAKKYMPRAVRDNIRKNTKKLKQDDTDAHQDSVLRTRQ